MDPLNFIYKGLGVAVCLPLLLPVFTKTTVSWILTRPEMIFGSGGRGKWRSTECGGERGSLEEGAATCWECLFLRMGVDPLYVWCCSLCPFMCFRGCMVKHVKAGWKDDNRNHSISSKLNVYQKGEREKQIQYANTYIWNLRENKGQEEPSGKTGIKTQTY